MRILGALCLALLVASCRKEPAVAPAAATEEATFWRWMAANDARLASKALEQDGVPVMLEIGDHLAREYPGLIAELALDTTGKLHTLVISADGDRKLFESVKKAAAAAPALPHFKVVAFRPRRGAGDSLLIEGRKYLSSDFFFRELAKHDGKVDIEVLVKGATPETQQAVTQAAYLYLDGLLGEYDVETKVAGIEVKPLPASPPAETRPLTELIKLIDAL